MYSWNKCSQVIVLTIPYDRLTNNDPCWPGVTGKLLIQFYETDWFRAWIFMSQWRYRISTVNMKCRAKRILALCFTINKTSIVKELITWSYWCAQVTCLTVLKGFDHSRFLSCMIKESLHYGFLQVCCLWRLGIKAFL